MSSVFWYICAHASRSFQVLYSSRFYMLKRRDLIIQVLIMKLHNWNYIYTPLLTYYVDMKLISAMIKWKSIKLVIIKVFDNPFSIMNTSVIKMCTWTTDWGSRHVCHEAIEASRREVIETRVKGRAPGYSCSFISRVKVRVCRVISSHGEEPGKYP